jgi:hypothetical protein
MNYPFLKQLFILTLLLFAYLRNDINDSVGCEDGSERIENGGQESVLTSSK